MACGGLPESSLSGTSAHSGVALIIGNSYNSSSKLASLTGSIRDASNLTRAFEYLGFRTHKLENASEAEIMFFVTQLGQHRYPRSCRRIVFAFSGHGGNGFVYSEDEKAVTIIDIVNALKPSNACNSSLAAIARMFFFDTCRGEGADPGIISRGGDEEWKSRVPSEGNILLAYATTPGYKAFENGEGLWSSILAKKLVTSNASIYDILTEVNRGLIKKIQELRCPFQQPQLLGQLNEKVDLLTESGKQPQNIPAPNVARANSFPTTIKSSKSRLNEFCNSREYSTPKYFSIMQSDGHFTSSVSFTASDGRPRQYQCTEPMQRKQLAEERAAELALAGARADCRGPSHELKRSVSCSPSVDSSPKSLLNKKFQENKIVHSYDTTSTTNSFRCTLCYKINGRSYQYSSDSCAKKQAEESVARRALNEIDSQLAKGSSPTSRGGASILYKSKLNEHCDAKHLGGPEYNTVSVGEQQFMSTVNVPRCKPVEGPVCNSKKEAEQLAAKEALKRLGL